jgi:hypothetical protein
MGELGPPARWREWSVTCPELWEAWTRLQRQAEPTQLRGLLTRDHFGPRLLWHPEPLTRHLYWADLLGDDGQQGLVWRCEAARQVGKQVLV